MYNLSQLEKKLADAGSNLDFLVYEDNYKIDAIIAALRALSVETVDQKFVDAMIEEIYQEGFDRCSHCGLIGGH